MIDSEYKKIKTVLLYVPGQEIENIKLSEDVLHRGKISLAELQKEYLQYMESLKSFSIGIKKIEVGKDGALGVYNLMYTRDLLFMTSKGAIIAGMSNKIRKPEISLLRKFLSTENIPVYSEINESGTFEGADGLWLNKNTVIIGVGNRTDKTGFLQLYSDLQNIGIKCIEVPAASSSIHLLGSVQIVDKDLAFVRASSVSENIIGILKEYGYSIVSVKENDEICNNFAMNIVTISPRKILMPSCCPGTKKIYCKNGLDVVAELDAFQISMGGGGLGCATAILEREI